MARVKCQPSAEAGGGDFESAASPDLAPAARGAVEVSAAHASSTSPHGAGLGAARFAFFEQRGVAVSEIVELNPRYFLADEPLNGLNVPAIFGHHKGKRITFGLHAAGPADAMDIVLRMLWHVIVN